MTRHTKLMLAFLAILTLAATSCAKLQARDNLNKGVRAFSDAHYEKAVDYFKQAVQLDPDLTTAELYLATAYSQQYVPDGRGEDNAKFAQLAIQTFEDVLKHDPNNVNAIAGLAGIYYSLGTSDKSQLRKSREYYMKYAQLDSTNPAPYYTSPCWIGSRFLIKPIRSRQRTRSRLSMKDLPTSIRRWRSTRSTTMR